MSCSIPSAQHWSFAWGSDSLIVLAVPVLQAREHTWGSLLGLVDQLQPEASWHQSCGTQPFLTL